MQDTVFMVKSTKTIRAIKKVFEGRLFCFIFPAFTHFQNMQMFSVGSLFRYGHRKSFYCILYSLYSVMNRKRHCRSQSFFEFFPRVFFMWKREIDSIKSLDTHYTSLSKIFSPISLSFWEKAYSTLPPKLISLIAFSFFREALWYLLAFQWYRWQIMGTISGCWDLKVNLKAKRQKCIYKLTLPQRCPNEIIKTFVIEDFLHLPLVSTTPVVHFGLRISREYSKISWHYSPFNQTVYPPAIYTFLNKLSTLSIYLSLFSL